MKRFAYKILLLFLFVGFVSCKNSYVITIETQKPAEITFPDQIRGVVVVNNAVSQPSDGMVDLKINKKAQDKDQKFDLDTVLQNATVVMAKNIQNENYYEEVYVREKTLRKDNEWLALGEITKETRDSIYEKTGCNIIVSLDRLIFDVQQAVVDTTENYTFASGFVFLYINARATMTCSVYLDGREKHLTSFSIQDSAIFSNTTVSDNSLIYKEIPGYMIQQAASFVGEKAASYFTPTWEIADRMIYSSMNSRMQEADKYFKNHKWDNARLIWMELYEEKDDFKQKGRLAMNIAVSYEMEDQLDVALDWANRAKKYYDQITSGKAKEDQELNKVYILALNKRISNNHILDAQFGIKNN